MGNLRRLVLVTVVVALAGTGSLADDGGPELHILKARIDFGRKPGTDRVELKAAFDPAALTAGLTPGNSDLAVTIGPVTVISLPPIDERTRLRSKKDRIWRVKVKRTREHRDSLKLRIHTERGKLRLTGERLDLRDVRGLGAEEVTFTLTLAGATFTKTLEMGERENRWRYRYTGPAFVPREPGGGIPPIDPGDQEIRYRYLYPVGVPTAPGMRTVVCRTRAQFEDEWTTYGIRPGGGADYPLPEVDFTKEMVVIIDQGRFNDCAHRAEVASVTEDGDGLAIRWYAWSPDACPCPCLESTSSSHFIMIAVTRRDGPVTFTRKNCTWSCCVTGPQPCE